MEKSSKRISGGGKSSKQVEGEKSLPNNKQGTRSEEVEIEIDDITGRRKIVGKNKKGKSKVANNEKTLEPTSKAGKSPKKFKRQVKTDAEKEETVVTPDSKIKRSKRTKFTSKRNVNNNVTACFLEDGNMVEFEVENNKFDSEDDSTEEGEIESQQLNNSAIRIVNESIENLIVALREAQTTKQTNRRENESDRISR